MKINTKIILLIIGSLVISSAAYGLLSAWQLSSSGNTAIFRMRNLGTDNLESIKGDGDAYRQKLVDQKKEYLKSQVQTTIGVLEKAYSDAHDPEKLRDIYRDPLQNAVNTAFGILVNVEKETGLSLEERQTKATDLIKNLRYGPENKDYFWINDTHPNMVMHPYKPQLDGKDLSKMKDPNGKKLFVEFVQVCRKNREGFVDYYWPKYGADKPLPKLSFVRLFKPWNWIIGSGVYMEVAEEKLKADAATLIKNLRYGPENKDYFWINDMHPYMVMHPYKPQLDGKDLSNLRDPNGKRLFIEFVQVCRKNGEGFVDYHWPKYGADEPQPKLSFVKSFEKWNWIIGTGIYIDDIDVIVGERENELSRKMSEVTRKIEEQIDSAELEIKDRVKQSAVIGCVICLFILVVVLSVAFFYTRKGITSPINNIIGGLNEGADQVASASGQISSASHSLAEGASEHAASIEETSSSLEEMSSMTKHNADNANQADSLMKEANHVVTRSNDSMVELTASMEEISKASEETSKIIKTIDEIAFQTNLLALNAAVEAARAGEAGAGFAVVAEEVRNLALRSADAARNTALLIEGTVEKVKGGSELVVRTSEDFNEVAARAAKVGELVSEIAVASNEQSQGIEHVSKAIVEMDNVIQQNAATAEESASASEEMNAQAEEMKKMVGELLALVSGNRGKSGGGSYAGDKQEKGLGSETPGTLNIHQTPTDSAKRSGGCAVTTTNEVTSEQVNSMGEKDFHDF